MNVQFKCCEKLFTHYVCTQCSGVIHKTCVSSGKFKSNIRHLGNNKVICCHTEEENDNSLILLEDKNSVLEETISELVLETQHKNRHLERLKLDFESLLTEASERESDLNEIIRNNDNIITGLKKQIGELKEELSKLKNKATNPCSTQTPNQCEDRILVSCSTQTVKSCKNVSTYINMAVPTAQTLEDELIVVSESMKRNEIAPLLLPPPLAPLVKSKSKSAIKLQSETIGKRKTSSSSASNIRNDLTSEVDPCTVNCKKLDRILVYGDNSASNCAQMLKNNLDKDCYSVQGWVKPGASLCALADSVFSLTKDYDSNDYVILFIDFNYRKNLIKKSIDKLLSVSKFSNVILCLKYNNCYMTDRLRRLLDYINSFSLCRNASIKIIYNVAENGSYRFKKGELCKIVSEYVMCNNVSFNIVLRSISSGFSFKGNKNSLFLENYNKMSTNAVLSNKNTVDKVFNETPPANVIDLTGDVTNSSCMEINTITNNALHELYKDDGNVESAVIVESLPDKNKENRFLYPRLSQWDLQVR